MVGSVSGTMIQNKSWSRELESPPQEAFEFLSEASFWRPNRIKLSAWIEHVPFAFWLVEALRPSSIVELGTYSGTSYAALCQAVHTLRLETRCYAIDTWKGDKQTGFYGDDIFADLAAYNREFYSGFSSLIRSTFDEASQYFEDGSIDLLHIDGCHTYEAVRHDFERWLPKLSSRAVVLLHDTNVREREFGVFHLWNKLQSRWPTFEFIHGHGLGILGVGADLTGSLPRLFQANERANVASAIRSMYSGLGKSMEVRMDKERELSSRAEYILELERAMACKGSEIEGLQRDLAESKAGISHLERKIESLRTSRCWKITAPLRWIDHLFSWRPRFWSSLKDETIIFIARIAIRFPLLHRAKVLQSRIKRITEEHQFDCGWYRSHYEGMPGVTADPLLHYLLIGVNRDCRPNPLFDSSVRNGSSPNFLTDKKPDYGAHCGATKVNEAPKQRR
jgi:Methyltransferase domain